jgi:hypothetical protein
MFAALRLLGAFGLAGRFVVRTGALLAARRRTAGTLVDLGFRVGTARLWLTVAA